MLRELGIFIITTLPIQYERELKIYRYCNLRRLDGDTSLLLILPGVRGSGLSGLGGGDDAGLSHQGVGQGGLAVVHVGNHGHVPDVPLLVHTLSHLVYREVHLQRHKHKAFEERMK